MKTINNLLVLTLILISTTISSQQSFDTNVCKTKREIKYLDVNFIKIDLTVKIDNELVNDSNFVLTIVDLNSNKSKTIKTPNSYIIYLDFNRQYEITFSHNNTNIKSIIVDTEAPIDNWYIKTSVNLSKQSKDLIIAGGIRYNFKSKTFEKYKI